MFLRWIVLPLALVLAALFLFRQSGNDGPVVPPSQSLPWQIALNADGTSTVFGITLDKSQLAEVLKTLGDDMEMAIIAAPGMPGNLEMYYGHYRAGLLTGKLILQAEVPEQQISQWRGRAIKQKIMVTGEARKYTLDPEDVADALQSVVSGITFVAAIRLDEEIVLGRFGEPDQRIQTAEGVVYYLYEKKGLAITISEEVKDVIQYVAPKKFSRLQQPLEQETLPN